MKCIKLFIATFFFSLALVSCSSDDEEVYSCDKSVNLWVKAHVSEIQKMDRAQWLNVDQQKKIPIYRAFTPEQRIQFWESKFKEVNELPWTLEEKKHIEKVIEFFRTHEDYMYESPTDGQLDEIDKFFYKWQSYAIDSLGWKKELCYAIAGSGEKLKNTKGELELAEKQSLTSKTKSAKVESSCNCNLTYDFCIGIAPCENVVCNGADKGCGWLWMSSCNGLCGGI